MSSTGKRSEPQVRPASDNSEPLMLEIQGLYHNYGLVQALRGVSLTAKSGEFLTILGESGSGKTTMLRMISGLEQPTSAERISIDGQHVAGVSAAQRNCTTVFQNYALFPHMSVRENVEYGLSVRGVPKIDRKQRAIEALEMVRLGNKSERGIAQLSGGERQRVALARALVTHPSILLLDEPLGALDEKLRQQMQEELVSLHKQLGMTFIYITHSQEEALTMSDRIALMRQGQIVQLGTPQELFDRPVSRFCADFMGFENILTGSLIKLNGTQAVVEIDGIRLEGVWSGPNDGTLGQQVCVAIRSERLRLGKPGNQEPGMDTIDCTPGDHLYRGKYVDQRLHSPLGKLRARIWDQSQQQSEFSSVSWRKEDCVVTAT